MALHQMSAFHILRPVLERLSGTPQVEDCNELIRVIPMISPVGIQNLHEYILVPIMSHVLDPAVRTEMKCKLLDCAWEVLSRTHIPSAKNLMKLMSSLMMQLFDQQVPSMLRAVSEEMKLGIIRCVLAMISNMTEDVQDEFYVKENVPSICQVVYICLQVVEQDKYRALRVSAMKVILALAQAPQDDARDSRSPLERQQIADIFQFAFPGITSKLSIVVTGDPTQGSEVTCIAVRTLSYTIALVMEGYDLVESEGNIEEMMAAIVEMSKFQPDSVSDEQSQVSVPKDSKGMQQYLTTSRGRTKSWRNRSAELLGPFITKMAAQHEHPHWKVRKEVACGARLILLRCPELKNGLYPLLDALIVLAMDEHESVQQVSEAAVRELSENFSSPGRQDFLQLVEENFYLLLTRLPRLVQEEGGSKSASSLALVSGYVKLLGPALSFVLSSSAHLQRLTLSLLHALTLDSSCVSVANEYAIRDLQVEQIENMKLPWTRLCYSPDDVAAFHLRQLCELLSSPTCGVLDLLGPQLMDILSTVPQLRKESAFVLNALLLAGAKQNSGGIQQLAQDVLDLYLSPGFWQASQELTANCAMAQLQNKILLACLITDGVGCCVSALGKDETGSVLLRLLYHLLERAGSSRSIISLAGRCALTRVAAVCGYGTDLMALIAANMDYIGYHMKTRLRHSDQQIGVFDALNLVLRYSSPAVALGLQDIVQHVLDQSLVSGQEISVTAQLRVFLTFSSGVHLWLRGASQSSSLQGTVESTGVNSDVEIDLPDQTVAPVKKRLCAGVKKFKEYCSSLGQHGDEPDNVEENDPLCKLHPEHQPHDSHQMCEGIVNNGKNAENGEEEKQSIPELVKLLVSVVQRCLHFLPSRIEEHQFLALKTLRSGLWVLKSYPDVLLPVVHQTWAPLVGRLHHDQPPLIIRSAFQLLRTLAYVARDFLRVRTLKEVIPELTKYLQNTLNQSRLQDRGSAYRFSQNYKTQLTLLNGLGPLCSHLELCFVDFHPLLMAALPYLSCYQPQALQTACIKLVHILQTRDPDAVWWTLVALWTPPHLSSLLQLTHESNNHECKENVCLLLQDS